MYTKIQLKYKLLLASVFIIFLPSFGQCQQIKPLTDYLNRGSAALDSGKDKQAAEIYSDAVKYYNRSAQAYDGLGVANELLGYRVYALNCFDQALSLDPKFDVAYANRAQLLLDSLNKPDDALKDVDNAIRYEKTPKTPYFYYTKSRILARLGAFDKAITCLDDCLQKNPNLPQLLAFRGECKRLKGNQLDDALKDFDLALNLEPKNPQAIYGEAMVYVEKKYYYDAIVLWDMLIKENSQDLETIIQRGNTYYLMNNFTAAITDFRKAAELSPLYAEPWFLLGDCYIIQGNPDEAIINFKHAIELAPEYGDAYAAMIRALVRMERFSEAKNYYDIYHNKSLKSTYTEKKWTYFDEFAKAATSDIPNGQIEIALNDINLAIRDYDKQDDDKTSFPFTAGIRLKAYILARLGRKTEAIQEYKIALNDKIVQQPDVEQMLAKLEGYPETPSNSVAKKNEDKDSDIIPAADGHPVFYAILIPEEDYADSKSFHKLTEPVKQLSEFQDILISEYNFTKDHIKFLKNADNNEVLYTIENVCSSLTKDDNLIIYFAGHGFAHKNHFNQTETFWVPANGKAGHTETYIPFQQVVNRMNFGDAGHIMVIADACFAGAANDKGAGVDAPKNIRVLYDHVSRTKMTGNQGVVSDESLLAFYICDRLKTNKSKFLSARTLFDSFSSSMINLAQHNIDPQYVPIEGTGDDGGDFIFFKN